MFNIMLFHNVSAPIRQLHRMYDELNEVHTYSEAFFAMLEADEAIEPSGPVLPTGLRGTFELRHVDFSYPNGTPALHDVSLTIAVGVSPDPRSMYVEASVESVAIPESVTSAAMSLSDKSHNSCKHGGSVMTVGPASKTKPCRSQ